MIRLWLAAIAALVLDQITKQMVASGFAPGESKLAIPHALYWTYVQNHRGAFGLFGNHAWLLVLMSLAVLAVFWFAFRESATQSQLVQVAFGGIVGGAIGNMVDRFHYGFVVDFIDLRWWPVFNVADSCITVGVALLVLGSLRRDGAKTTHAQGAR